MNLRPLGYEPNELPDCSTPRHSLLRSGRMISPAPIRVKEPAQLLAGGFYFRVVTVTRIAVKTSGGMSSISTVVACRAARMVSR